SRITALSAAAAATPSAAAANASDVEVAKAQLGLDQNELNDSVEDLARETGDQRIKLQQELATRQAAMKQYKDRALKSDGEAAVASAEQYNTLAQQLSTWRSLNKRKDLITQAEQLARADAAALTADQVRLKAEAADTSKTMGGESSSDRIERLQQLATWQNILSILDDRLQTQQQLIALYGRWGEQVEIQRKIIVHLILGSIALIAAICLLTILAGWGLQLALAKMVHDVRQRQTVRKDRNLGTRIFGPLLGLLAIFGEARRRPTTFGLVSVVIAGCVQDFRRGSCD